MTKLLPIIWPSSTPAHDRNRLLLAILLVTILGAVIRLSHLGDDSFWLDEVLTIYDTRDGLSGIIDAQRDLPPLQHMLTDGLDSIASILHEHERGYHPPLLHGLTYLVITTLGETEFTARLPSALAGILSVPLIAILGAVMKRPRAGMWAALLLAVLPFHLRYSQEARYYALLMLWTLLTLITLYLSITRNRLVWWLAYAISTAINLYTHYGALVVLATQGIVIAGWAVYSLAAHRRIRPILMATVTAATIVVLYAPWIQQAAFALAVNTGPNAPAGTTGITSTLVWLRQAFLAFGFGQPLPAVGMAALAVIGLAAWARQRGWLTLIVSGAMLLMPLLLIAVFQVARWAFPKYIIYALPAYLLAAGAGIDFLLSQIQRRLQQIPDQRMYRSWFGRLTIINWNHQRAWAIWASTGAAALLVLSVGLPLVLAEYDYIEEDWKSVAQDIVARAQPGDVFMSFGLDLPDGFNQGGIVLPYYLQRMLPNPVVFASHSLTTEDAQRLKGMRGTVWAAMKNRAIPARLSAPFTQMVGEYQGGLYLASSTESAPTSLQRVIQIYEQVLPVTLAPSPRCMLQQELGMLRFVDGDLVRAERDIVAAREQCPQGPLNLQANTDLLYRIDTLLLAEYRQAGRIQDARATAHRLLMSNAKDSAALEVLTMSDLIEQYRNGHVVVRDEQAPGPVDVRRFTMPYNGDWGDVLFAHPPVSIVFTATLPAEATELRFRTAMAPESWDWGGDGSTFVVTLATAGGSPVELYRQHISNQAQDRAWHPATISLAPYAGQTVTLTFTTDIGPGGNSTGDWAGWGEPRILWRTP